MCKALKAQPSSAEPNPSLGREVFLPSPQTEMLRHLHPPPPWAAFHPRKGKKKYPGMNCPAGLLCVSCAAHARNATRVHPSTCVPSTGGALRGK